jgi:hypothetical protein
MTERERMLLQRRKAQKDMKKKTISKPDVRDTGYEEVVILLNAGQAEQADHNISDLVSINAPAAVLVERGENPVKFVLGCV